MTQVVLIPRGVWPKCDGTRRQITDSLESLSKSDRLSNNLTHAINKQPIQTLLITPFAQPGGK